MQQARGLVEGVSGAPVITAWHGTWELTVRLATSTVDTCANDHHIVYNGETAFAANPLAVLAHYIAVCEHRSGIHHHTFAVEFLRIRQLIVGEEIPRGAVDNLIWSVAENVDNGIRRIKHTCLGREVWLAVSKWPPRIHQPCLPWIEMNVVSMAKSSVLQQFQEEWYPAVSIDWKAPATGTAVGKASTCVLLF